MKHTNEEKFKSDMQLEVANRIKDELVVDLYLGDRKVRADFEYVACDGRHINCTKTIGIRSLLIEAISHWEDDEMEKFISDIRFVLRKAEADYEKHRAK